MAIVVALILIAIGAVFAVAATKPATIIVQRSIDISASAERIFPLIEDLRRWAEWPAGDEQSKAAKTFGAIAKGRGATAEWAGSGSAGAGRMEITESTPPSRVVVAVDFRKPFVAHNVNDFTLEPRGNVTRVTWFWRGENVLMLRLMSVFTSPDRMMGSHFEAGLAALKRRAEAA